jgi:plasmid stabilization system protein ParE
LALISLTDDAEADLFRIAEVLAAVSRRSGHRFLDGYERVVGTLAQFPHAGHRRNDLPTGTLVLSAFDCVVVYRILDGDRVEVLRVVHGKTDFGTLRLP